MMESMENMWLAGMRVSGPEDGNEGPRGQCFCRLGPALPPA